MPLDNDANRNNKTASGPRSDVDLDKVAKVITEVSSRLRRSENAKPAQLFQSFAEVVISSFAISKVSLLLMDCRPSPEKRVVTGFAFTTSAQSSDLLQPWPAERTSVFNEHLRVTAKPETAIRYIDDTAAFFKDDKTGSAFGVFLGSQVCNIVFIFSKPHIASFSPGEQQALRMCCESLAPYVQSILDIGLPPLLSARREFQRHLKTDARGIPNEVLDTLASLWRSLYGGYEADMWLFNDLSGEFLLSGHCDTEHSSRVTVLKSDPEYPETQCRDSMSTVVTEFAKLPPPCRELVGSRTDGVLVSIPLLYAPLYPREAPEQCLGVVDIFLEKSADWFHNFEQLRSLAQDSGLAIQESFNFQRLDLLQKFNQLVSNTLCGITTTSVKDLKQDFFSGVIELITKGLGIHGVSIFQSTDEGNHVVCVATSGLEGDPPLGEVRYEKGESKTGAVFATGQPRIYPSSSSRTGKFIEKTLSSYEALPLLFMPIRAGQEVIGVIRCVEKLSPISNFILPFSRFDQENIGFIVEQLAPIMEMIAIQEKRELGIAVNVHEIRAPACTLRDASHALRQKLKKRGILNEVRYDVDDMVNSTQTLITLVNMASHAIGAQFVPRAREVNVEGEIVARLKAMLYPQARDRKLTITFDGFDALRDVVVDPDLLEQVLFNLLTNAIKYCFPATDIQMKAEVLTDRPLFRVVVQNWGEAIPLAEREKIFLPFFRGQRGRRAGAGNGLGLAIVRRITDVHGGSVQLTGAEGSPTEFTVELPLYFETQDTKRREQR